MPVVSRIRHSMRTILASQNMNLHEERCIYKIPAWLKGGVCDGNDATPYTPEVISFGPYHQGNPGFEEMEKHKWRCLQKMLTRQNKDIQEYQIAMESIKDSVWACYEGPLKMTHNEFVDMLILDGCFILEFLWINKVPLLQMEYEEDDPVFSKYTMKEVIARDILKLENQLPVIVLETILKIHHVYPSPLQVRYKVGDLILHTFNPVLVTNEILTRRQLQILRREVSANPDNKMLHCLDIFRFSLLHKPAAPAQEVQHSTIDSVINNILKFILKLLRGSQWLLKQLMQILYGLPTGPPSAGPNNSVTTGEQAALTNVSHEVIVRSDDEINNVNQAASANVSPEAIVWSDDEIDNVNQAVSANISDEVMVTCVEDLRLAGVKLRTLKTQPFVGITFDPKRGLLHIPPIQINDSSKTWFLNLIAYEQCHYKSYWEMRITDYVAFMDKLVNSSADVRRLHKAGILVHQLGSNEEVADLFNGLVRKAFVTWEDGKHAVLYKDLNSYCANKRHGWFAILRIVHFKNPWAIISVIVALILLVATLVQMAFAIVPYSPKH